MKKGFIKIIIFIFIIICLIGIVFYSFKIFNWKNDLNNNFKIQEEIKDLIIINNNIDEVNDNKVDFKSLKKKNNDTVAYLKVNNTNIDYPVVKGKDNDYYLHHNFKKEWSSAGWVFADYHNKFDNSDRNIVIYGHSMLNGSMFGTLRKVLKKEWYNNKDNHYISFITEKDKYTFQVFSVYVIKAEDYYINTKFKNNNEFDKFVKKIKSRSKYNFDVKVNGYDKILTLSSCYDNNGKRIVLHAKLINN